MGPSSNAFVGHADLRDVGSEYARLSFLVRAVQGEQATMALVQIKAVRAAGGDYEVDVQPMVHQVDGAGNAVPHGTIHGLPVWRLQGGNSAVVVKPAVGDIGMALFAQSDISGVKRAKKPTTPGSARKFDWADGVYMGGVLNAAPTQKIVMDENGITLTPLTGTRVKVDGKLEVAGEVVADGEGTFNSHTVGNHKHGGVTIGTGVSGLPTG